MSADTEPDRFPGAPHPRETTTLVGHKELEHAFLDAYRSGRLHHAWIIVGPEGIGKATLAYRMARFLLAYPRPDLPAVAGAQDLSVPADHPATRRVAAGGHANLFVLRRQENPDKPNTTTSDIPINLVRRAGDFFASSAAEVGWRIAIVDAADDLNNRSANALLKVVEEPPRQSIFLIVAHSLGRVLPTIRSRCRILRARPPGGDDIARVLVGLGVDVRDRDAVLEGARGSVRRALVAASGELASMRERVRALLAGPEPGAMIAFADGLTGAKADLAFEHFVDVVLGEMADLLRANSHRRAGELEPVPDLWNKLHEFRIDVETLNVDRRPFVLSALTQVSALSRRLGASGRDSG